MFLLIALLPFSYFPLTSDPLETTKQTLLVVLTFAAALAWIASLLSEKRSTLCRGWLLAFPLLFLTAYGVSAWQSTAPFLSWVGGAGQEYTSFLTMAALTVLFYLVVHLFQDRAFHRPLHLLLLLSSLIVGMLCTLALLFEWSFLNTIGTVNAAGVYLVAMSSCATALWIARAFGTMERGVCALVLVTAFFYLLIIDYWLLWMLFALSITLVFAFVLCRSRDFPSIGRFVLPLILLVAVIPFWFWMTSPFSVSVPAEVTPSARASREIAGRALSGEAAAYGTGPGTYALVYARERGEGVNQTEFFNTRFDRASSLVWTWLPTIGPLGFSAFVIFAFSLLVSGLRKIVSGNSREEWLEASAALVPFIILLLSAGFYHFNLTLLFLLFLFGGLIAARALPRPALHKSVRAPALRLFASLVLTIGALCFLVVIFFTSQRYAAEMAYAKGVRADRNNADIAEVVRLLDTAATLNRFDDRAYRVLAEALLYRVGEQLASVSAAAELTPESRAYVQALVASSVNAAVRATELSPNHPVNWLMRGRVYRELMSVVPNAAAFSLSAFEQAIKLEPLNPSNWNELGIASLAAAERERPLTVAQDKEAAARAKALVEDFMKKAEAAFGRAIELKPNYAPAHYQLSLAYERQGRLNDAIGKMESVARYNLQDVGVAFQLGQLYLRRNGLGDLERARRSFEYAVSLAPSYSNARWFLASVYEQEGDVRAAIAQVEEVLELNPSNQLVKSRFDRLLKGQASTEPPVPLP